MILYIMGFFNSKKTVCIKFGNKVIRNEAAFLNNSTPSVEREGSSSR